VTRRVARLELSGLTSDAAVQAADELVRDRSVPDLSCLLIVDEAMTLPSHGAALENLLTSGRVPHFVCVATGEPAERGLVQLPGSVATWRDSAILWVGDRFGVDWVPGAAAVTSLRPDDGPDGLQRLLEILSSVTVYDRVRELAAGVPNATACPGLRLAESETDEAAFSAVFAEAVERLEPHRGVVPGSVQPFADLRRLNSTDPVVREDGELARLRRHCLDATEDAERALRDAGRLSGLMGSGETPEQARSMLAAAGDALADLRAAVSVLLDAIPTRGGITELQRERLGERLRRAGISLGSAPSVRGGPVTTPLSGEEMTPVATVSTVVAESLRDGEAPSQVAERLAATERVLRPPVRATNPARLDQCCPVDLMDRLRDPAAIPRAWPWFAALGALATALASLAGIVAGAAIAVVWIIMAATAAYRSAAGGPERSQVGPRMLPDVLAAVVGVAAGSALASAVKPPAAAAAACVVLAIVTVAAAVPISWRARIGRWRQILPLGEVPAAAQALTDLVVSAVGAMESADSASLDTVARARIVIEAIVDQMRKYACAGRGIALADRSAELGPVLVPVLRELAAAVVYAQLMQHARDGEAVRQGAQAKAADLIVQWDEHTREHGLLAPPTERWARYMTEHWQVEVPAAAASSGSAAPVLQAWQDSIKAALSADPTGLMWQLCLPADIGMLDVGGSFPVLPFAPQLVRAVLSGAAPPGTEWTSEGHRAGLLRLVPMRLDAVSTNPPTGDEQE
jgi:hypothetical protein